MLLKRANLLAGARLLRRRIRRALLPSAIHAAVMVIALHHGGYAQEQFMGVFHTGQDHKIWVDAPWNSFKAKWDELNSQGYRLVDAETAVISGERRYSGIWVPGNDDFRLWNGLDWQPFYQKFTELESKGLRLTDFEVYVEGGKREFLGVWRTGFRRQKLLVDANWQSFKATWKELNKQKYRLIDIETYLMGSERQFAGLWEEGEDNYLLLADLDWEKLQLIGNQVVDFGLRLIDVEAYSRSGQPRYLGVWRSGEGGQQLVGASSWPQFLSRWKEARQANLILTDLVMKGDGSQPKGTPPPASPKVATPVSSPPPPKTTNTKTTTPAPAPTTGSGQSAGKAEYGQASYYADKFQGRPTASGEAYDRNAFTAAHRTHPFGTYLRVTNLANGKNVVVRVNDRGPHVAGRVVDLSYKAAEQVDAVRDGLIDVKVEVVTN